MTKQKRLLIVDDEADIREFLSDKAAEIGAFVTQASNGKEALELFNQNTFEAILSDIRMPEMTGIELLREIRAQGHQIPFVILTAYGEKDVVIEALQLGAFDFIEKPSNDKNLFGVLEAALELGAELNFWKSEGGITESLVKMGEENTASAAAEIERIFSLVKGGRQFTGRKKD